MMNGNKAIVAVASIITLMILNGVINQHIWLIMAAIAAPFAVWFAVNALCGDWEESKGTGIPIGHDPKPGVFSGIALIVLAIASALFLPIQIGAPAGVLIGAIAISMIIYNIRERVRYGAKGIGVEPSRHKPYRHYSR